MNGDGRIGHKPRRSVENDRTYSFKLRTNTRIILKMKFIFVVLVVLQIKLTIATGDPKKHVHFKIYVPEIIKHHIHTKTVFIHVHEPKKKSPPKKNEYVESHHDDWSVYSSYSNYDEHGDRHDGGRTVIKNHEGHQNDRGPYHVNQAHVRDHGPHYVHQADLRDQGHVTPYEGLITSPGPPPPLADNGYPSYYRDNQKLPIPHYDDYPPNYLNDQRQVALPVPPRAVFQNGVTGYSYPPQYQIHENVIEDGPPETPESYRSSHEEGHSKRLHSETGHLYMNELNNFYDDKHEEGSESVSTESKEFEESYKDHGNYGYVGDKYIDRRTMIR